MMKNVTKLLACSALAIVSVMTCIHAKAQSIYTINGVGNEMPMRYTMPLISNGSLSIHLDEQGSHNRVSSEDYLNSVLWQGRRKGAPADRLFPFGFLRQEIICGDKTYVTPASWTQSLDADRAMMICQNNYDCGIDVKSQIFVHADKDIVVIRKTFTTEKKLTSPIFYRLKYDLSCKDGEYRNPQRMEFHTSWSQDSEAIEIDYKAFGLRDYEGRISFMCPTADSHDYGLESLSYTVKVMPSVGKSTTVDFFILYSDIVDGKNFIDNIKAYQNEVKSNGYEGLLASHAATWADRWSQSHISIPDPQLQRAYIGGEYMLLSNATRWSFPVGIGLWEGRYFAFDEACCYLGLASSNHLDIARRAPEFRKSLLQKAVKRTKDTGCKWVWETMEDGSEGAPSGYWMDHVFHMSHVATAAWTHFLYTNDREYLIQTAYPILLESARFYNIHMVYWHPDGSATFGKCTDLERLGPGIENPFFSSCGAIYTFECAAKAAKILGIEDEQTASFLRSAAALRKTLPRNDKMYIPYKGCKENSIAVTTGMYPYPVLSTDDPLERAAVNHFWEERYSAGNMYKMGSGLCPWYASWIASAMSNYGERTKSLSLLKEAASQIGYFAEHFEINEDEVVMRPWFATAAGNYVNAVNQTLLLNREDNIFVCYSAPIEWKDYSFTLPCYGNMVCRVKVQKGKLTECTFTANSAELPVEHKTVKIPAYLIKDNSLTNTAKSIGKVKDGMWSFDVILEKGQVLNLIKS